MSARGGGGGGDDSPASRLFPGSSFGADATAANLPPAVVAFEKFQRQNGGVCGGWNEEDHAIYVRLRQKHKGRTTTPAFAEEALPLLAPRSAEDLTNHEAWLAEHERLLEAKKQVLVDRCCFLIGCFLFLASNGAL